MMATHHHIKLLFLIRSLGHGGAERQLIELVKHLDKNQFQITVGTYYDGGALRLDLEKVQGIHVVSLGKKSRWDLIGFFIRLRKLLRKKKPDIVHGYNMGLSNELALAFGRLIKAKVVWGLRASNRDFSDYDALTRWGFRLGKWSSPFVHLLIANSTAAKTYYESFGYPGNKICVIPNGIDTEKFCPDDAARRHIRRSWNVADNECLIGLAARFHPMKGIAIFLEAAALLLEIQNEVRFVIVGTGSKNYQEFLDELATNLGIQTQIIWAGARNDMPAMNNALDIATSASVYGEGFSNTIGEAMACGVPCVVTDVGDSATVVGNTGKVVAPKSSQALCGGWQSLINLSNSARSALGMSARNRIVNEFSPEQLAKRTSEALQRVYHK